MRTTTLKVQTKENIPLRANSTAKMVEGTEILSPLINCANAAILRRYAGTFTVYLCEKDLERTLIHELGRHGRDSS
jgi:hypothetical protein